MSKELVKETSSLTNISDGLSIGGVEGLTMEDVRLPSLYIVQDNSKHAVDESGNKATSGQLFHTTRKQASNSLDDAIIIYAKGTKEFNEERNQEEKVWRCTLITRKDPANPFMMKFRGMSLWYGFQDFLNMMLGRNIFDKVIQIKPESYTTKETGRTNFVPRFILKGDTTEEEKEHARSVALRFKDAVSDVDIMEKEKEEDGSFEDFLNEGE